MSEGKVKTPRGYPKRKRKPRKKPGTKNICQRCGKPWSPDAFTKDKEMCDRCIITIKGLITRTRNKKIEQYMSMVGPDCKEPYDKRAYRIPFNRRAGKFSPKD